MGLCLYILLVSFLGVYQAQDTQYNFYPNFRYLQKQKKVFLLGLSQIFELFSFIGLDKTSNKQWYHCKEWLRKVQNCYLDHSDQCGIDKMHEQSWKLHLASPVLWDYYLFIDGSQNRSSVNLSFLFFLFFTKCGFRWPVFLYLCIMANYDGSLRSAS